MFENPITVTYEPWAQTEPASRCRSITAAQMADALGYANEFAFRPFLLKADSIDAAEAIVTEALQGGKFGIIWRASPQDILKARIDVSACDYSE